MLPGIDDLTLCSILDSFYRFYVLRKNEQVTGNATEMWFLVPTSHTILPKPITTLQMQKKSHEKQKIVDLHQKPSWLFSQSISQSSPWIGRLLGFTTYLAPWPGFRRLTGILFNIYGDHVGWRSLGVFESTWLDWNDLGGGFALEPQRLQSVCFCPPCNFISSSASSPCIWHRGAVLGFCLNFEIHTWQAGWLFFFPGVINGWLVIPVSVSMETPRSFDGVPSPQL